MPKLRKEDVADLDVAALDEVEYSTEEFDAYAGEVPPVGTELTGYVKRMWWTRTQAKANGGGDDPMIKVLWVAADNEDDEEEFNDCPFWLNAPLIAGAKFRWAPFLDVYGLTLSDIKNKTYVASKEDQNGAPIERIGTWKPGEDHDESWCRIISGQEPYNGEMQARVKEWLMWDAEDEDADPDAADDEDEDEEYDEDEADEEGDEDEDEDEEQEATPARGRKTTTRAARTASKAPATRTRTTAPARGAKSAPATTRGRAAAPARAGKTAAAKPARAGRGRAAQPDPPF